MIVRTAEHRGPTLGATVGWHAVVRSIGVRPWWLYVPASEWDRKVDVRQTPGSLAVDSTIGLLGALALAGLIGGFRRRWDLTAAALIGLGMSVAIGLAAASNPSGRLLSETLGYTMWWGSELGLWVWLILAWALWLGLVGLARPALGRLRRGLRQDRTETSRLRLSAITLASIASIGGVFAVGSAVAGTGKPDSHVYEYRPIRETAAAIERLIPRGETIRYGIAGLDLGTQPMEPAIRFLLVRHGDRVLAEGSYPRLGPYYELYHRPVQWSVLLVDGSRPQRHMTLAARIQFTDPWGREVFSAWVGRVRSSSARPQRTGLPGLDVEHAV